MAGRADTNEHTDADIRQCKTDILRARDRSGTSENKLAESPNAHQEKPEIPRFDLADEILAEQRKITAVRRKAPAGKVETQEKKPRVETAVHTIECSEPPPSAQDRIITEIVAKDIEKLCRRARASAF